ncbi:CHASE domain-containing protein [Candidatus Magnetominusculus xianensis]|uniref:histidine kinase n=1 Tax=Candidatus Magnetominusculus xianensis TaxID=1748249 RepID=A0ABR5SH12_9BACT|nr:CHASE domain-containing protein [Candidatus Magnetominusculus xianensis]KWT86735.1 putative sensor histidine kinase [Candidatus Magnetominusculus xianensis]MBF0402546.1 CHASE domain-containing protein [Nitrospirota bacterium]
MNTKQLNQLWVTLLLIALVSTGAAFTVYHAVVYKVDEQNLLQFRHAFDTHAGIIEKRFDENFDMVTDLAAFYRSIENVSATQFSDFVQGITQGHSSQYAIEWIPRVPYSQKTEFERRARQDGVMAAGDFYIYEKSGDAQIPVNVRDEYFPVYYGYPKDNVLKAIGFDLASNPVRLKSLEQARDTGALTATAPVVLVQEQEKDVKSFLLFMPVYYGQPETLQDRRQNLRGFTLGVFRYKGIIDKSFLRKDANTDLKEQVVFEISDKMLPVGEGLVYRHNPKGIVELSKRSFVKTIDMAGRTLEIKATPVRGYFHKRRGFVPLSFAVGTFIIVGLVCSIIFYMSRQAQRIKAIVEDKTSELRGTIEKMTVLEQTLQDSEKKYRQLIELSQEGVWLVDKNNITTLVNRAVADMIGYTVEEIVGVSFLEFVDDESKAAARHSVDVKLAEGEGDRLENVLRHKNGSKVHIYVSAVPFIDAQGNRTGSFGVITDITKRKEMDEQLKKSVAEQELLLRELHHRVKNNLQVIAGLVGLQLSYLSDEKSKEALRDTQSRIQSIALVHERLYKTEKLSEINIKEYIHSLVKDLFIFFTVDKSKIGINLNVADVHVGIGTAIPCGLIINELFTNIIKYAFTGRDGGEITIELRVLTDSDELELIVGDNGVGMPEGIEIGKTRSLGLKVVTILTKQLRGTIEIDRADGTRYILRFMKS